MANADNQKVRNLEACLQIASGDFLQFEQHVDKQIVVDKVSVVSFAPDGYARQMRHYRVYWCVKQFRQSGERPKPEHNKKIQAVSRADPDKNGK
jgi:hypothetical protein